VSRSEAKAIVIRLWMDQPAAKRTDAKDLRIFFETVIRYDLSLMQDVRNVGGDGSSYQTVHDWLCPCLGLN